MDNGSRSIAIIGSGGMGMRHAQVLRELGQVSPIVVPKRRERLLALEAEGFAVASDLREAAERGASLCIVATDTGEHEADALASLAHGLDVLVEKPMAAHATGARRVRDGAASAGRRVFVGCVLRFSESLGRFRSLLGEVGRLHAVRIECQSYLPQWRPQRPYQLTYSARRDEGGVLRDLIHEIDYAGWLFGWPQRLGARVRNLGRLGIDADECAQLWWETEQGASVSVALDYLTRPARRRICAAGEAGTIEWDGVAQTVTLMRGSERPQVMALPQSREAMLLAQAAAFLSSPGAGRADARLATGDDGCRALAICDAARRASETKQEEAVIY
jgi:predicted dehydrogenase